MNTLNLEYARPSGPAQVIRCPLPAREPPAAPPLQSPQRSVAELTRTVSASRLGAWQRCRLQFYFRYVLQIRKPPTPSLHVGSIVHLVLQQWNKARWRKEPFSAEKLKSFFHSHWTQQQLGTAINWEGAEEEEREGAWRLLERYFLETPIKADERPEGVETACEADLGSRGLPVLIGYIDLVRSGGRIVDFKTSGKSPDEEQAAHTHETQLACYAVLYREATERREGGLELHHLVKTKKPKLVITAIPPVTAAQESRLYRVMESYVAGVQREDFVPSPGIHCYSCDYYRECRGWSGEKESHEKRNTAGLPNDRDRRGRSDAAL